MNLANRFTLVRLFLTPIFVLAVLYHGEGNLLLANLPLIIFLIAISTDVIDGFIARRYSQTTRFGAILDPLADKFLLIVAFITLTFTKTIPPHFRIPPWVLIIILTRDMFLLTGASIIYMTFEYMEFKPNALGKITTFLQMMTVLSVLLRFSHSYVIWTGTVIFTLVSGIQYLARANRILSERVKRGL